MGGLCVPSMAQAGPPGWWCCCAFLLYMSVDAVESASKDGSTPASTEASHDSHHPVAWSTNQHGAFIDNVTHQRVVKHKDHYDRVMSKQQSSNIFLGMVTAIAGSQILLHW